MTRPILLALLASFATLHAQTTHVVDINGGANFTQIRLAVAAARPGDTILVRPGTYDSFTVQRGLTIVGGPGVAVLNQVSGAWYAINVMNVPAGETAVLRGFRGTPLLGLRVWRCAGAVHLEDMSPVGVDNIDLGLSVISSPQVSMHDVTVVSGLVVGNLSNVLITDCSITGGRMLDYPLSIWQSNVTLAESTVTMNPVYGADAAVRIQDAACTLTVVGDATTVLRAGAVTPQQAPAIRCTGGHVRLDPQVTLVPVNGGPAITGATSVTTQTLPSLHVTLTGNQLAFRLRAPGAVSGHTLVSLPARPPLQLPFGESWLSFDLLVLDSGAMPPTGIRNGGLTLPALPPGLAVALQALVVQPAELQLSMPAVVVLP